MDPMIDIDTPRAAGRVLRSIAMVVVTLSAAAGLAATAGAAPANQVGPAGPSDARVQSPLEQRAQAALERAVPARWLADITVDVAVVDGDLSWASVNGLIEISRGTAAGDPDHLADVMAHEFAHLIAFAYGTWDYPGAAPEGWPAPATRPEEVWADCVQTVFTGRVNPSHGLAPCGDAQLAWAADWLAAGPREL